MLKLIDARSVALAAACFTLVACAATGPTAYTAADDKGYGYSETRVEENRYRITYRGGGGVPADEVENYALMRAAELSVQNGYDWFHIVSRDVYGEEKGGVSLGAGVGGGSYGRHTGVNVGVGGNLGKVGARAFFTARLEVVMGAGEHPEDGDVYDARSIIAAPTTAVEPITD